MALKALLLRSKIDAANKKLEALRAKDEEFSKREAELTNDVTELGNKEDATEEDKAAVETAVNAFDADRTAHEDEKKKLQEDIDTLNKELDAQEADAPKPEPAAAEVTPANEDRKGEKKMIISKKFDAMNMEERSAFVARDDVKKFLEQVRSISTRALTNTDVLIPETVMPLLVDMTEQYSKLMKHVNVKPVSGTSRVRIMGIAPEAVWTEQKGKINELALAFSAVEMDGFKVAGYFALDNATLEDNDVNLLAEIIYTLGQSMGLAVDKAIVYGTGTKMPTGIVTALKADATLKTSNILNITLANTDGVKLFKELLKKAAAAKSNYSDGQKFWVMNETTLNLLKGEALSINATGAIVTGIDQIMPVIGGAIETEGFMPDGVIAGGYGSLYCLAQRAGAAVRSSDQVKFLDDQAVVKGVSRYDGKPVIPAGFVYIGINGVDATTIADPTFPTDAANA